MRLIDREILWMCHEMAFSGGFFIEKHSVYFDDLSTAPYIYQRHPNIYLGHLPNIYIRVSLRHWPMETTPTGEVLANFLPFRRLFFGVLSPSECCLACTFFDAFFLVPGRKNKNQHTMICRHEASDMWSLKLRQEIFFAMW